MSLRTVQDIQDEVLVRAHANTTTAGLYTDTKLNDWLRIANRFVTSYKKWPNTQGRVSTTFATGTEEYSLPEGWKINSIRILQVGGKRYQKLNFEDYQIFREEQPDSDRRVFSTFERTYFINPNTNDGGTTTLFGQYSPAVDPTDKTALTVFSDYDEEANEAMVEEMLSYAKFEEKKPELAQLHHQKAVERLEQVWKRIQDEQFGYQTTDRSLFERIDVEQGSAGDDEFKRNQFF